MAHAQGDSKHQVQLQFPGVEMGFTEGMHMALIAIEDKVSPLVATNLSNFGLSTSGIHAMMPCQMKFYVRDNIHCKTARQ